MTFFLTVLTRLGLKDEIDLPGHDYEKNVWAWYRLTFVNAADPEVMAFAVNVNMAGQYLSYFLFTTSVISVVSLIFGEKSSLVRVNSQKNREISSYLHGLMLGNLDLGTWRPRAGCYRKYFC